MVKGGVDGMMEKKEINIAIGTNIKQAREQRGMTQERLSEMMGIGVKSLSAIERGVVGISLTQLKNVCTILGVSSDRLIFGPSQNGNVNDLTKRLERLTPAQYAIADAILAKLIEAFQLNV